MRLTDVPARPASRGPDLVRAEDEPEVRHLLEVVGMRADVRLYDEWGSRSPTTELIVIADANRAEIDALLDGCRAG